MANRKGSLDSEIRKSKSYSMDEFMGAYLRGELELKPDGKVTRTKSTKTKTKWLLVPKKLTDVPEGVNLEEHFKWHKHQTKKGKTFHVFGLMEHEWRKLGYEGNLVKRYVPDIEAELQELSLDESTFNTEFEQSMLEWEAGASSL